jgi:hypothetical protein
MPGIKGSGGPPPKRTDQRRRRNKPEAENRAGGVKAGDAIPAEAPAPGDWAYGITQWYESLGKSGQAVWYSAADWASAWLMAETMNAELAAEGAMKAATVANWLKLNASLLATEGDRRRAAIELQLPPEADDSPAPVTDLRAWRETLNA